MGRTPALCALVLSLWLTSCATMIRGTTEELQLTSNPLGAKATLSNGQSCVTPCSLTLPRNGSFSVTFTKESCDAHTASVFPVLAGAGVILGGIIDYGTGAVYSLQPNPVLAGLNCREPIQAQPVVQPSSVPASSGAAVVSPEPAPASSPTTRPAQ